MQARRNKCQRNRSSHGIIQGGMDKRVDMIEADLDNALVWSPIVRLRSSITSQTFPLSDSGMAVLATVMQLRSDTDLSLSGVPERMATDLWYVDVVPLTL